MPRESVRSSDYNYESLPDGYLPKPGQSSFPATCRLGLVEVGWSKSPAGSVEVATVDETMVAHLVAQVENASADGNPGEAVRNFFSTSPGLWVSLDRDGINDLIALLRRARDGAFRRDQ